MKTFYGICVVLGAALPYSQFLPWLQEHGLDLSLLVQEMFQTRIGAFAWMDVIVSVLVLIGFILFEGKRSGLRGYGCPFSAL